MARKYEVTIPFCRGPWYTGFAKANSVVEAVLIVKRDALYGGFFGKHQKPEVKEVQE